MARMYPAYIFSGTQSRGEIDVFERLKNDPVTSNWIVLHSLDIAHHRSQISGEIDFVVIVPRKGVLCVEIKAHNKIKRENGLWYYGSSSIGDARGPFKQAAEAMHSIRKKVSKRFPELANVLFWSAVIFPYLDFNINSDEWHSWQVIDRRQLSRSSIGELILNVFNNAHQFLKTTPAAKWFNPENKEPDLEQCNRICNYLRPDFEFFESLESRVNRRNEELKLYTQEQFEALDSMELNDRVIFSGPAGTGKTLLAMEAVRRNVCRGNKVLFCCYNRLLATWLNEQVGSIIEPDSIGTLHKIMLSVSGLTPPIHATKEFWERELPDKAIEALLVNDSDKNKYDILIIDEAQDLMKNDYLDFLDLWLIGGLRAGKWIMFGDFEKQAIYSSSSTELDSILKSRLSNYATYSLRVNCRNRPRVAELVHLLGGLNPKYSKVRRPDDQVEPSIIPYKNENQQQTKLVSIIDMLVKDGYTNSEIVILSPRSDEYSTASKIKHTSITFNPIKSNHKDSIGFCTIHAFKGLEAPVIIVTDIEEIGSENAKSLLYIAITRSLERLFILVSDNARKGLLTSLTGQIL